MNEILYVNPFHSLRFTCYNMIVLHLVMGIGKREGYY